MDANGSTAPTSLARRLANLVLHTPVPIKAQVLLAVVVLGSCLQASGVVPETVFSDKYNPINKYLVKFSWFWTSMWMFVTISITAALYCAFVVRDVLKHLGRIAVGHAVWFSITTIIEVLDNRVGECSTEGILTAKACARGGHKWVGFDISGHIFLLSYCIFIITEEASNIRTEVWQQYIGTLESEQKILSKSGKELKAWLANVHHTASSLVDALKLFALIFLLIWSGMSLTTSLYFHTFAEKLLGLLISVVMWYVTYGLLYGRSRYLPSRPEDGILHPARHTTV